LKQGIMKLMHRGLLAGGELHAQHAEFANAGGIRLDNLRVHADLTQQI